MGYGTDVTLVVRSKDVEKAKKVIDTEPCIYDEYASSDFHYFNFSEIGYGKLLFLPQLVKAGVPYNSVWEGDYDYRPGVEYSRYNEEGHQLKTVYDSKINPDLGELLIRINNYDALKHFILNHKNAISVISWDNQEEHIKMFLLRLLLKLEENHD